MTCSQCCHYLIRRLHVKKEIDGGNAIQAKHKEDEFERRQTRRTSTVSLAVLISTQTKQSHQQMA